jgi:hypothetical protein
VKQGGNGRVRFQPSGQLLAVAAGSMVNIFDVDKQVNLHSPPKVINKDEMQHLNIIVSGEGLPQNWIDLLSHGGYNI